IRPIPTNPTLSASVIRRSDRVEIDAFLGQRLRGIAEPVNAERDASVDHRVEQELADLERRDAVRERPFDMYPKLMGASHCAQRGERDHAALAARAPVAGPRLAEAVAADDVLHRREEAIRLLELPVSDFLAEDFAPNFDAGACCIVAQVEPPPKLVVSIAAMGGGGTLGGSSRLGARQSSKRQAHRARRARAHLTRSSASCASAFAA